MGIISFTWNKNYWYMIIYYIFENAGILSKYFLNDDTKSKTNININL